MFENIRGRIRDWRKTHADSPIPAPKPTHSKYEVLEKPATREIATSTRTRWISFGLNRRERRAIVAQIKKACRKHGAKNLTELLGNPERGPRFSVSGKEIATLDWLRFQITNSPRNWPSNGGSNNPVFEGQI